MMKCVAIISRANSSLFGDGVTLRNHDEVVKDDYKITIKIW